MAAADGGATPPAAPADPEAPGAPATTPLPGPQTVTPKNITLKEKFNTLSQSWKLVSTAPVEKAFLNSLYKKTLHFLLQDEWSHMEKEIRDDLIKILETCSSTFEETKEFELRRIRYLILVAKDPWHHPVLKEIMDGARPEIQKVRMWIEEEGGNGVAERLKQLCAAGGKLEAAALHLAHALVPPSPIPQVLTSCLHYFAVEALLVLLMRANKTSECISLIKSLEINEAMGIVKRLAKRNKSQGRIWKNSHDTALLCCQFLVATSLVRGLEDNQLYALAYLLASLYSKRPDELGPSFRKLLQSADTATHIYIVCRAVQQQYLNTMQPFICELYIRALTTGMNELERLKLQDESSTVTSNTSHKLANWFLSLANLLSSNQIVSAECVLTAFSLHPSKYYYEQVEKCSLNLKNLKPITSSCDYNVSVIQNNSYHNNSTENNCNDNLHKMNVINNNDKFEIGDVKLQQLSGINTDSNKDEASAQSLISSAVLEGDGLGLSTDVCRDLVVLLSGPRLKYLTWDLNWDKLSQYCLSYMADTEEGTKTVTTELKYVHLDYSQFEIKEPEVHDIYFGIEKGYEHHLEIDEDEEDIDEIKSNDLDCDSLSLSNINKDKDLKQTKKKSSKKRIDDNNQNTIEKVRVVKDKGKKIASTKTSKKISNIDNMAVKNNVFYDDIYYMMNGNSNFFNDKFSQNNTVHNQSNPNPTSHAVYANKNVINTKTKNTNANQSSLPSFYRKQMELHEANKKKLEKKLFTNSEMMDCKKYYPQTTYATERTNSNSHNYVKSDLTYCDERKENFKNFTENQNASQFSINSNSFVSNQNVKNETITDFTPASTSTDWEMLIGDNVYKLSSSINESSHKTSPKNQKFTQDYIKSLNMQSTKLPVNTKREPIISPDLKQGKSNKSEVYLSNKSTKTVCYAPQNKFNKQENPNSQFHKYVSNSTQPYVQVNSSSSSLQNYSSSSESFGTDSYNSNAASNYHQQFSTNWCQNFKEECFNLNNSAQPEVKIPDNEFSLSETISPNVLSSIIVGSRDEYITSEACELSNIVSQNTDIPVSHYNIQMNEGIQDDYSKSNQLFNDLSETLTLYSTNVSSESYCENVAVENFDFSIQPSIQYEEEPVQNFTQMCDNHNANVAANRQNVEAIQQYKASEKNTINTPAINHTSVTKNKCYESSKINSGNIAVSRNTQLKNISSLSCSVITANSNLHPENMTGSTNSIKVELPPYSVLRPASSFNSDKSHVNLHDYIRDTNLSNPTVIQKKIECSNRNFEEQKTLISITNTKNKQQSLLRNQKVVSNVSNVYNYNNTLESSNKNSLIIKTDVCINNCDKKPTIKNVHTSNNLKYSVQSQRSYVETLPNNCLINDLEKYEKCSQITTDNVISPETNYTSEHDDFLMNLPNTVSAGLDNLSQNLEYELQNVNINDNTFEKFIAELQTSVNAGISMNRNVETSMNMNTRTSMNVSTGTSMNVKTETSMNGNLKSVSLPQSFETINKNFNVNQFENSSIMIQNKDMKNRSLLLSSNQNDHTKSILISNDRKLNKKTTSPKIDVHIPSNKIVLTKNPRIVTYSSSKKPQNAQIKSNLRCINSQKIEKTIGAGRNIITIGKNDYLNKDFSVITSIQQSLEGSNQSASFIKQKSKVTENPCIQPSNLDHSSNIDKLLSKISNRTDLIIKVGKNSATTLVTLPTVSSHTCEVTVKSSTELLKPSPTHVVSKTNSKHSKSMPTEIKESKLSLSNRFDSIDEKCDSQIVKNSTEIKSEFCSSQQPHSNDYSLSDLKNPNFSLDNFPKSENGNFNEASSSNSSMYDTIIDQLVAKHDSLANHTPKLYKTTSLNHKTVEDDPGKSVIKIESNIVLDDNCKTTDSGSILSFKISGNLKDHVFNGLDLMSKAENTIKEEDLSDMEQIDFESAIAMNVITPKSINLNESIVTKEEINHEFVKAHVTECNESNLLDQNVILTNLKNSVSVSDNLNISDTENPSIDNSEDPYFNKPEDTSLTNPENPSFENSEDPCFNKPEDTSLTNQENTRYESLEYPCFVKPEDPYLTSPKYSCSINSEGPCANNSEMPNFNSCDSELTKDEQNSIESEMPSEPQNLNEIHLKNDEEFSNDKTEICVTVESNENITNVCPLESQELNESVTSFNHQENEKETSEIVENTVPQNDSNELQESNDINAKSYSDKTNIDDLKEKAKSDIQLKDATIIDITLDDSDDSFNTPKETIQNDEVIEILSDDEAVDSSNSDVEFVASHDPIAIEPVTSHVQNSDNIFDFLPRLPKILQKSKARRRWAKRITVKAKPIPKPLYENQYIIDQSTSAIIKTKKIPACDLQKLISPCKVIIDKLDLIKMKESLSKSSSKKYHAKKSVIIKPSKVQKTITIATRKTNVRKPKPISDKALTTCTRSNSRKRKSEQPNNDQRIHPDKTESLCLEIKKETDENFVHKSDDVKSEEPRSPKSVDENVIKLDDQDTKNQEGSLNNPPDVLDSHGMNCHKNQINDSKETDTNSSITKEDSQLKSISTNLSHPDILYQSNSNTRTNRLSRRLSNKTQITQVITKVNSLPDNIQCSNICPDLLNKSADSNTFVAMQQPDIVVSNEKKHISHISSSESENINVCSNYFKTYQKTSYHKNKRKSETNQLNSVKKIRTNFKIDLPEVSQEDINLITHDDFSMEVERLLIQGSDGEELSWSDDPVKENLDTDISGVDFEYKFDFLSKNSNLSPDECSRNSFYSPIFNECETDSAIESYIEKCENLKIFESSDKNNTHKHLRQGKGFGVRSDRGNLKDSIRGRPEGPAAVLSDTFTTRPPLALHNFFAKCNNKENVNSQSEDVSKGFNAPDLTSEFIGKEINNNSYKIAKTSKSIVKQFFDSKNENNEFHKDSNKKLRNSILYCKYDKMHKISKPDIFSRVPGLEDLDFMRPCPSTTIVQVVQLGQSPVTSAQQNQLTTLPSVSQSNSSNEYGDVTTNNSGEYQSLSNEDSHQSNSDENNISESKDKSEEKQDANESNKKCDENSTVSTCEISNSEANQLQSSPTADTVNSSSDIGNIDQIVIDKSNSLNFSEQNTSNYTDNLQADEKDISTESLNENQTNSAPSSSSNFISANRGQTLVNLLSQKIIHSPVAGQHVQMATFPKGTINALSLQQALAQILPPPLSQASNESVIQSANHSTGPQVVHIVQGKSNSQSNNSFGNLLVDSSQSSVMNNPNSAQVLHIIQGKPTPNTSNSSMLNQSQIAGTTFSGLSLVDSNTQQSGNQVLHIVNAGMQSKNNTAQVLKRVNLLTSITNPQGNNEQKMVQFVCKSSDGKPIQLNAQHQRGMVLRLQPIDNTTFATPKSENQTVNANISTVQSSGVKPQIDQAQELKSRSVYEENYAKFIQNSSQIPSSPEKSTTLPKFNQAFGKSVFQDNAVPKANDNIDQSQNIAVSASNEQSSQDISNTVSFSQLGHMNNPPLLIRKNIPSNIVHQNVVQQVKQSVAPVNIQTIQGGVIYTRQIPMNTINLITVPSSDMIDEVQLQSLQKQNQDKANSGDQHLESQVVKIVSQDQQQSNNAICQMESPSEESNANFSEQNQNNVNTHPLLTQMRIKVPMLSKTNSPMVAGARVVRPVLQIQRNLIPGTNPAVYQQLVLTTAPSLRQPVPTTPTSNIRPSRPTTTTPQESNMSTSTLEQLREFDMVLEQVKERSTVQPGSNSNSTFSDTSPQRHVIDNTELDSSQSSVVHSPAQREVLYSIGPNQTVNVTYVNQKVISKTPTVLTTTYTSSDSNISTISSQNSPSNQIAHGLVNTISHSKPCSNTPTKVNSKSIKTKPSKPANPSSSSASKPSPVAAKTSLQKPLEDEQTTQRILYILAEYKEQVENSPDKDKPAPRRRSNPPTNPTTSSKRKKGSSGSSKKSSSGQSLQEMSPLGGEDAGHTMGSEDSSCGLSQGECTDNSIQGTDNQSPQASPQKAAKKLLFQPESDMSQSTTQLQPQQQSQPQQQRNVIIADGQTIAMTRPGAGKTTAVLMPANYLLPMSMVKGGQQITIVTNQGPKILSVPQGEGNATNTLFLQRLISPTGLKPMLTRPGQVRHVRLPANTVQNLQAFNLSPTTNVNSQDSTWIGSNSLNTNQPKLVVEYNPSLANNSDLNPDSVKSEISDSASIKDENVSLNSEHITKLEDSGETSENRLDENLSIEQSQTSIQEPNISNLSEHILQQVHVSKSSGNTLNLIQVHSLNSPECGKLFTVQNSSGLNSLIQIPNKSSLHNLNTESDGISSIVQETSQNMMRKQSLENQYLNTTKSEDGDSDMKLPDINQLDENLSISDELSGNVQQGFVLSHSTQQSGDAMSKCHGNRDSHTPWSTNGSVNREVSPNFGYENSPHRLPNQEEHHDSELPETEEVQGMSENVATRVLRHSYSPSSSPTGPRHLYHKMFISTPAKKSFGSEMAERSVSAVDEEKQYVQVLDIRNPERKTCSTEAVDVATVQGARNSITSSSTSAHSAASLRHKYAVMEHELRLQKSLSEECEDLGVDSPSASDLFPEAELLFAASPSSQFDQSQDGCILPTNSQSSTSATHVNPVSLNHQIASSSSITNLAREPRIITDQPMEVAEESEFARMHPNTTFHSGEIELVSDDADDASVNISFRSSSNKKSIPQSQVSSKRGDIVRSVIEGIGSSGGITTFSQTKISSQFSMVDLARRSRNTLSSLQSSDDYSEGADDSMNSAESKEGIITNKSLDGILTNEIVKRDINLSSTESSVCMSSNIIQRNVTQVIRHSSSDQISLPGNDSSDKLCNTNMSELAPNGRSFLLESSNDARNTADAGILKSIMMERDGRDALTCSSPEQHSELFWESNSNSNQSEEHLPQAPTNLLDFSSEDSNKCCKSPLSCEETNSTDSSSLGGHNHQSHNSHHPLRLNSVIKTSVGNSSAADGPILHNALISSTPNVMSQDISKKLPITLNSIHKSDSNTSSSPEEDINRTGTLRTWGRSMKTSGGRKVISPRSLSAEINMGAEIETSSSEGVSILTKSTSGTLMHSGSSTPEEGGGNNRRVSLRGSGGIKRSCHCCGGAPATPVSTNNASSSRRARRRPPPLH